MKNIKETRTLSKDELVAIVEGVLFVSGDGIEIAELAEKLDVVQSEILSAIEKLKAKHNKDSGINIIEYKNKVQLCSNPEFADQISAVLNPIKEKQLTKATLETIAVIAYKQPVTRLEIEQVRGVNCDYTLQVLMNFKLIEVVGRKDVVGKPLLFGTTDEFLKRFQIKNIKELPDYSELMERIKLIHSENEQNSNLFNKDFLIDEEDVDAETIINDDVTEN